MTKNGKFIKGSANKQLAYSLQTIKTIEDANKALIEDLKPFQLIVDRKIKIKLNEAQNAALVSHFYNTGGSSTLCELVNTKSKDIYDW